SPVRTSESPRPAVRKTDAPTETSAPAAANGSSLWDLLTPEEQAFFSRQDTLGALTYGPGAATRQSRDTNPAPLGGRIDVKA
ncbi:MAG: hypothetical protein K8S21_00310, partial [Gemmatimonadetes bacterium]|nr:hypothetical protein [Gemmatimonadota bacterium]